MTDTVLKRSTHLEQILKKVETRHEPEVEEALDGHRDTRLGVPTPMLDLILKDGTVESFSYVLLSRVRSEPSGRLLLFFGDDVVVIEGRNLTDIRQKVRMHRKSFIREGTETQELETPENAEHVSGIFLTSIKELEKEQR